MQIFLEPTKCSTPQREHAALYFNRFRGKPAISEFDWPFTPNHRSSSSFATDVSSVLPPILLGVQPAHG